MKIYLKNLSIITLFSMAGTIGCKKKDNEKASADTISGELTGKWQLTKRAYDENLNLTIDNDEVEIPSTQFAAIVTLNADGTGTTMRSFSGQPSDTTYFTWSRLSAAEISCEVTKGSDDYLGKFAHIKRLTDSELVIIDTARGKGNWELNWSFFKR